MGGRGLQWTYWQVADRTDTAMCGKVQGDFVGSCRCVQALCELGCLSPTFAWADQTRPGANLNVVRTYSKWGVGTYRRTKGCKFSSTKFSRNAKIPGSCLYLVYVFFLAHWLSAEVGCWFLVSYYGFQVLQMKVFVFHRVSDTYIPESACS